MAAADATYNKARMVPDAVLTTAKAEAEAVLLAELQKAWTGPTSDNPEIMERILVTFTNECISLYGQ